MSGACCDWFRVSRNFVSCALYEAPLRCNSPLSENIDDTSTDEDSAIVIAPASSSRAKIVAAYTGCTFVTGDGESME